MGAPDRSGNERLRAYTCSRQRIGIPLPSGRVYFGKASCRRGGNPKPCRARLVAASGGRSAAAGRNAVAASFEPGDAGLSGSARIESGGDIALREIQLSSQWPPAQLL